MISVASIINAITAFGTAVAKAIAAIAEKLRQSQLIQAGRAAERADAEAKVIEHLNDATEVLAQHKGKKDVEESLDRGEF